MMTEQQDALGALREALVARRQRQRITDYAKVVGVAPKRLMDVMVGNMDGLAATTDKAKVGLAESVTRIFDFVAKEKPPGFALEEVLLALGQDPGNLSISEGLRRARTAPLRADTRVTGGDPTLGRIISGAPGRDRNLVRVGTLLWYPYAEPRKVEDSFAGRFMKRLVGSLNPEWEVEVTGLEFAEVLTPETLTSGRCDAILAIYDTAARRLAGFRCLHLPGLGGAMGALAISEEELEWLDVLDQERIPGLKPFVQEGDAAQLLLNGACAYPKERTQAFEPAMPAREIAAELAARAKAYVATGALSSQPIVFLADASVVKEVHQELQVLAVKWPSDHQEFIRLLPHGEDTPVYPVGIATSIDSERWHEFLHEALVRELLINTAALTAQNYAELLSLESSIHLVPLDRDLPEAASREFACRVATKLLKLHDQDRTRQPRIKGVIKEMLAEWGDFQLRSEDEERPIMRALREETGKQILDLRGNTGKQIDSNPQPEGEQS